MKVILTPSVPHGAVKAIASKSMAHRALICAAFSCGETRVRCEELNDDIRATVGCLISLGAGIEREGHYFTVSPVKTVNKGAVLDCKESGSTMRFLVPVACLLGADSSFLMSGRLPERPLSPLREELERCGVSFSAQGSNPLVCRGRVEEREFSIQGNVSSQFISGLLFAIAISGGGGRLRIIGKLESAPYVDLTIDTLKAFGVDVKSTSDGYEIDKDSFLVSPAELSVEGDWSGAAFLLSMGAIGRESVTVERINNASAQGDRAIADLLARFGAKVSLGEDSVTVSPAPLHGIEIDASQIPDLVPVLATVASVAEGRTVIYNAARLKIKESDRLQTTADMLNTLGAHVRVTDDGLIIDGVPSLVGGRVSACGDHRIAMSAAVASVACREQVEIEGGESAAKSYPDFWRDIEGLGIALEIQ